MEQDTELTEGEKHYLEQQKWYEEHYEEILRDSRLSRANPARPRTIWKPPNVRLSDEFRKKVHREYVRKRRLIALEADDVVEVSEKRKMYRREPGDDAREAVKLATREYRKKQKELGELNPLDPKTYPMVEKDFIKKVWDDRWEFKQFKMGACLLLEEKLKGLWEEHGFVGSGVDMWKYQGTEEEKEEAIKWKEEFVRDGFFDVLGPVLFKKDGVFIPPQFFTRWVLEEGALGVSKLILNYYGTIEEKETWGPHLVSPGDLQTKWRLSGRVCTCLLKRARCERAKREAEEVKTQMEGFLERLGVRR